MKKAIRRIYTRAGDKGSTGILSDVRLSKHHARIEALGSLDELNSFLGFLLSLSEHWFKNKSEKRIRMALKNIIEAVQRDCFVIGSDISQPLIKFNSIPHPLHKHFTVHEYHKASHLPRLSPEHIHHLEELIDHFQAKLPPLKNFILPQGNPVGSFVQVLRAICRRTERRVAQLAVRSKVNPLILAYLNRLSDLFFVLARAVNLKNHKKEIIWKYD